MSTTLVLAAALDLAGLPADAIPRARALLDALPPAGPTDGVQLLRSLRATDGAMARYVACYGWAGLAELARAGATVDELVEVTPMEERACAALP